MSCPRCDADVVAFAVPAAIRDHAPAAETAICTRCLRTFPAAEAGAVGAIEDAPDLSAIDPRSPRAGGVSRSRSPAVTSSRSRSTGRRSRRLSSTRSGGGRTPSPSSSSGSTFPMPRSTSNDGGRRCSTWCSRFDGRRLSRLSPRLSVVVVDIDPVGSFHSRLPLRLRLRQRRPPRSRPDRAPSPRAAARGTANPAVRASLPCA